MKVVNNGTVMYAKHGILVDADRTTHLSPKPAQNTLNHVQRSFKVTHFEITEKPTGDCVLYNNVGFRVGNFEGKV